MKFKKKHSDDKEPITKPGAAVKTRAQADAEKKAKKASANIPVRATGKGYYDNARKNEGDVFVIHAEEDFSDEWMEKLSKSDVKELKEAEEETQDESEEAGLNAEKKPNTDVL